MEQNTSNLNENSQMPSQTRTIIDEAITKEPQTVPSSAPNPEKPNKIAEIYNRFDTFLAKLIVNSKLRKFLIYFVLAFVCLVFFLLVAGAIFRGRTSKPQGYILNKPKIETESPQPSLPPATKSDLEVVIEETQNLQIPPNDLSPLTIEEKISL